jgi:ATPase family associated with various cellular activities (AAA)
MILLRIGRLFDHLSDCRGRPTRLQRDAALIALLLKASAAAVDSRLAPDAKLQASGLLHVERHGELQVLERVTALMRRDILPEADLYDQLLGKMTAEPLPWDAFAHLGRQAEVAASVLRAALVGHEIGVNILLYGPPGTGKSSFAAALAVQVGANLRPVVEADEDGGEPTRHERLAGLRLAQRLVASRNTLLLFDEAEDLFVGRSALPERTPPRVFIHRVLEQVTVPVIWTANDIGALGPAVLRRMTMCLELRIPSVLTRTRLWRSLLAGESQGCARRLKRSPILAYVGRSVRIEKHRNTGNLRRYLL